MVRQTQRSEETIEPCASCGDETAVGSVFYSDRHIVTAEDGRHTWLCTLCDARIRSSRGEKRLTDEQVRNVVENGSMAFLTWTVGGSTGL